MHTLSGEAASRAILIFFNPQDKRRIIHAGGDRKDGVPKRIGPGRAEIFYPRNRLVVQTQRITKGNRGLAVALRRRVGAEPGGIDLFRGNTGVMKGCVRRLGRHVFIALIEIIAKLDTANTNNRDLILECCPHLRILPSGKSKRVQLCMLVWRTRLLFVASC